MCGSMVDIQSPTAEIRRWKKKKKKKKKLQGKNIMSASATQGGHSDHTSSRTGQMPAVTRLGPLQQAWRTRFDMSRQRAWVDQSSLLILPLWQNAWEHVDSILSAIKRTAVCTVPHLLRYGYNKSMNFTYLQWVSGSWVMTCDPLTHDSLTGDYVQSHFKNSFNNFWY